MRRALPIILIALLSACANDFAAHAERYKQLVAAPTPSHWKPGAIWTFVIADHYGNKLNSLTFRISQDAAVTCSSGDWRKLELVEGKLGDGSVPLQAAYSVEGRALSLDLTGWCDVGGITGELLDHTFAGRSTGGPVSGDSHSANQVKGWRVK